MLRRVTYDVQELVPVNCYAVRIPPYTFNAGANSGELGRRRQ